MRDPSIHITKGTFKALLEKFGKVDNRNLDEFIKTARQYSIDSRSISVTNDKIKRDVEKITKSSKGDTTLLSDIIYSTRIKLRHRGVKKLNQDDRDWPQLKELTKLCNQFCSDFEIDKRYGYITYIESCFKKISSMRAYISKFCNMYESICQEYESVLELKNDQTPNSTKEVHDYFVNKIADRTGLYEPFENSPDKMILFYRVKNLCDSLGLDYSTFIEAQFAALDFCNGIPSPESLVSDKAKERLNKYLYSNNITLNKPKVSKDFWKLLKK